MVQPKHCDKDQIHSDKRLSALPQVILLSVKCQFYSTLTLLIHLCFCFYAVIYLPYLSEILFVSFLFLLFFILRDSKAYSWQ